MAEKEKLATKKTAPAAKKTVAAKKPAGGKAATAVRKPSTSRKVNKGDSLVCEVCGLGVVVDEISGYTEESVLLCCGKPMRQRAKRSSPAKK
jgi:hypothetical protein